MTSLAVGYIALTILVSGLFLYGYYFALKKANTDRRSIRKRIFLTGLGFISWWAYTFFLAESGFLKVLSLPPRFPLLLIIPLFIFTAALLFIKRKSPVIHSIPRSWPIYFQSFRILVESLFVASVTSGILHREVTIEGYNYDMIIGFSAPIIAWAVYRSKVLPERFLVIWNYLGLGVLATVIVLFTTTIFFPNLWGHKNAFVPTEFLDFPYILVAAFLMPMAVFVHIVSLIQLNRLTESHKRTRKT